MEGLVTLADVYRARQTIAPWVRRTPLVLSPSLSKLSGGEVFLKLESAHDTGAFKLRGATNAILGLDKEQRANGVVTVSTGNHGRAVAYAARRLGVRAVVCMSRLVPGNKVRAIDALGAEVRIHGRSQDEAQQEADRLVAQEGMVLIPPFDHPDVVAGQGVVGLELLEDLPDIDTVLVPLSGGGLIAGIAIALKAASSRIRIVGISMERGPAMYHSIQAGHPVEVEEQESLADSLGGGIGLDNRYTFPVVRDRVDEILLLNEGQIARGMVHLYREEQLVAEGAAAVGPAALLEDLVKPRGQKVAAIITGRNVDMERFTQLVSGCYPTS
ncbi:MAG: hydroxyectoine utilization dehydratase EutB [Candidatus Competibacteraceae bacterium]|nr:hydroxyectoine utilization dehydratase EutB [Candidatus Competibacteraceae bacterium]